MTTVSLALLGQALLSRLLVEDRFRPSTLEAVALASGRDAELEDVVGKRFGIRVEIDAGHPALAPRLEPKRDPALRASYEAQALQGWFPHQGFMLTALQQVEALYLTDSGPAHSRGDLAGRNIVLLHTAQRPHLDLLGHAIFGAELARDAGSARVSSRIVVLEDDPDLTAFLPRFPDVEVVLMPVAGNAGATRGQRNPPRSAEIEAFPEQPESGVKRRNA